MSDLKEQTKNNSSEDFVKETGVVVQVGDGIAQVYGFNFVTVGEIVTFKVDDQESTVIGLVFNLEDMTTGIVIVNDTTKIVKPNSCINECKTNRDTKNQNSKFR